MIGLSNPLQSTAALMPKQHIFLLSHMRAYTSLFGHIMGSNPAICGYYEMHIGYHSWKSLIRQKLLFFRNEDVKPHFSRMFDKVLHNDHIVTTKVLNNPRSTAIFCLRKPQDTIPSILKLYKEIDPEHDFNSLSFAIEYYVQRLDALEQFANSMERPFYYFDAESLKQNPDDFLNDLSDWLQLETSLTPNYTLQRKTSRQRYGDTSSRLGAGRIIDGSSESVSFDCESETINRSIHTYERVRKTLIELSASNSIIESIE
jgi:hypothetical protein